MKIQSPDRIILAKSKKKEKRIFIDMDGVLCDWLKAACKSADLDASDPKVRNKLKLGKDIDKIGVVTSEELWNHIRAGGEDWWKNLELLPWAKKLVKEMQKLGTVCILTSPGKIPETGCFAAHGKVLWIAKHLPDIPYIIAYEKGMCASKNALLIDDSAKKIKKFENGGGNGFLWPVQYCIDDGDVKYEDLIKEIKQFLK